MPYRELPHTADLRVEITANSLQALFTEGIKTLYTFIFGKIDNCNGTYKNTFSFKDADIDILFHDFLDEVLYITLTKKRYICDYTLTLSTTLKKLNFLYTYIKLPAESVQREIKAITYHNLHIEKQKNQYKTEVIMDV